MAITNNEEYADKIKIMAPHGMSKTDKDVDDVIQSVYDIIRH